MPYIQKLVRSLALFSVLLITIPASANPDVKYVSSENSSGSFGLAVNGNPVPLVYSAGEFPGVIRAISSLRADIKLVTGAEPSFAVDKVPATSVIIIGTLGKSALIDQLVKSKKLDVSAIRQKWEAFSIQTVQNPMPGVSSALVIAGNDKRGTIFGIYDLSYQIGVSPWHWWADVPVKTQKNLFVKPGIHTDAPAVKYRGIFLNDEAPALSGWSREKFGGFNSKFYEKVFELILRLKANYLWPAMWGNAFNTDDKQNPVLADEMGVVMGTSHHEPMLRAQQEWKLFGKGPWDYSRNDSTLKAFWRQGIKNMGTHESIVTIGMRGDGDEPMTEGSNIALLEKIVSDQRKILAEETGKPASQTPQIWALYKEVQDYYDKGMRVPDDVTLLLCDDNWGNLRKLPNPNEKARAGGYGIYYHFDYVGGPRNYKWLNTNPIAKVWEQMHLARQYGADRLWLVNVGDLKPMEFPIEFFLDYAWNPEKWTSDRLQEYTVLWAEKQFGQQYASDIADIISKYTKFNGRIKPELLNEKTYSLTNYREFENVVNDYNALAKRAEQINEALPVQFRDAFFQLVLHPVQACANLNELYYSVALNRLYAKQGRSLANDMAAKVKQLFARDAKLSYQYNKEIAGGKWNHMMDQTHIGYTYWQQPQKDVMPAVDTIALPSKGAIGVALEQSAEFWPQSAKEAVLPAFSSLTDKSYYIELFNRGSSKISYKIKAGAPLKISGATANLEKQERIWVSVDWSKAKPGAQKVPIVISSGKEKITVYAIVNRQSVEAGGFIEDNGYIAIEADHFTRAAGSDSVQWKVLPDHGKTGSAVTAFPVTAKSVSLHEDSPRLDYDIYFSRKADVSVDVYLSPTLNFKNSKGFQYAISIDNQKPVLVNIHQDQSEAAWARSVSGNIRILKSTHGEIAEGKHMLKFWMIDPAVVLQKIVINTGGLQPSYLGPPESFKK